MYAFGLPPTGPPSSCTQVDVYAFGVMLNELMAKQQPFAGMGAGEIRSAVLSGGRPELALSAPRAMQELAARCGGGEEERGKGGREGRGLALSAPRADWRPALSPSLPPRSPTALYIETSSHPPPSHHRSPKPLPQVLGLRTHAEALVREGAGPAQRCSEQGLDQ